MAITLPSNVQTGIVRGQWEKSVLIAPATGDGRPNAVALTSLTVTFSPSVKALINRTATDNPVTIVMVPTVCGVDSDGYLVNPESGSRAVQLIATDDPDVDPHSDWTYYCTYTGEGSDKLEPFSFNVPVGSDRWIANISPVPSSTGISLSQAQAAEAAAIAAAASASAFANAASDAADDAVAATTEKVSDGELIYNVCKLGKFGLTSCAGDGVADDGPRVNALITAIVDGAIPNAPIFFPAGTFNSSVNIDLPFYSDKMKCLRIYGAGRSATFIVATGSTSTPFEAVFRHQYPRDSVTGVSAVSAGAAHHIHDLRIDANKRAKFGILSVNGHAINLHNMLVKNACSQTVAGEPTAEIKITGQGTDYLSWEHHIGPNVRLEGGPLAGSTASTYGLWLNSSDNHVDGVVSLRHDTNANNGADFCESGGNNFWSNCHSFYSETGYFVKGSTAAAKFINCEADTPLLKGWRIQASKVQVLGCNIFWLNSAPGGTAGFDVEWDVTDLVIVGNTVNDQTDSWLPANGLVGASHLKARCVVTNNTGVSVDTVGGDVSAAVYNDDGQMTSVTAGGVAATYTYNADGTVATETRLGATKTFTYDASGNLTGVS